jgi:2-polyprenyl-3-methyl-5-hydroxy-6-metoxy-1,4-benzoquinol methylase
MGGELFERAGLWGSFEVVTALEVIEHPIYVRGFLENVKRALKPGGKLVITTPHPESPAFGYRYLESHPHHVRMWTPLRLEMVFGPGGTYSEIEREGKLAQIGAVFVWDGWDHPDNDPVADLASWTAGVKRSGGGE